MRWAQKATLTTAADFPKDYFLENLAMRSDQSALVTVATKKELWYVPPLDDALPVAPMRLCTFNEILTAIVEMDPDIFYVCSSEVYTTHESYLHRLDMRGWTPGTPVNPQVVLKFSDPVRGLNGGCKVGPNAMLIADMFAGLIWRVDLSADGENATPRVWLKHGSMASIPWPQTKPMQPGVNGVRYAAKTSFLYYSCTAQLLFMRVRVDPQTLDPIGQPEFVAGGRMTDDFCIDEDAGVAYLATHRQNTIDRVSLEPRDNRDFARHSLVGDPFTSELVGPSSGVWGRAPGDYGRRAYFLTDGGTTSPPPDGIVRNAKLLRVDF